VRRYGEAKQQDGFEPENAVFVDNVDNRSNENDLVAYLRERIHVAFKVPVDDIGILDCTIITSRKRYARVVFQNPKHVYYAISLKTRSFFGNELNIIPWRTPARLVNVAKKETRQKASFNPKHEEHAVFILNIPSTVTKKELEAFLQSQIQAEFKVPSTIVDTLLFGAVRVQGEIFQQAFVEFESPGQARLAKALKKKTKKMIMKLHGHRLEIREWFKNVHNPGKRTVSHGKIGNESDEENSFHGDVSKETQNNQSLPDVSQYFADTSSPVVNREIKNPVVTASPPLNKIASHIKNGAHPQALRTVVKNWMDKHHQTPRIKDICRVCNCENQDQLVEYCGLPKDTCLQYALIGTCDRRHCKLRSDVHANVALSKVEEIAAKLEKALARIGPRDPNLTNQLSEKQANPICNIDSNALGDLCKENESLEAEIEASALENLQLRKSVELLQQQNKALQEENGKMKRFAAEQESEMNILREELRALQEALAATESDLTASLRSQVWAANISPPQQDNEIDALQSRLSNLERRYRDSEQRYCDLSQCLAQKTTTAASEKEELHKEIDQERTRRINAENMVNQLRDELQDEKQRCLELHSILNQSSIEASSNPVIRGSFVKSE
jgi:RNA recognition motif-containing protein